MKKFRSKIEAIRNHFWRGNDDLVQLSKIVKVNLIVHAFKRYMTGQISIAQVASYSNKSKHQINH